MKVLVIGGTRFLGRHLVEALLARHHEITLFNRGRTAPGLFADVEEIHGDRELNLERLAGRRWDAVIDTCGYLPRVVRATCEALHGAVERYVFVSSISVYARFDAAQIDEDAPLAALDDPLVEDVAAHYGALKAACEREVQAAFGTNALLVRPGLIVGPFDPTGRFTYWPQRLAAGGDVVAPGQPGDPVQFIDVRDLAEWIVRALTRGPGGAYNATGPAMPLHFGAFLSGCIKALAVEPAPTVTWCSERFLLDQGVTPWTELPLWVPAAEQGIHRVSIQRALDTGLAFRPLAATVTDTLAWARSPQYVPPVGAYANVGLGGTREADLLAAWHAQGDR
jgi:2'-hydroxyisoflavone reductase